MCEELESFSENWWVGFGKSVFEVYKDDPECVLGAIGILLGDECLVRNEKGSCIDDTIAIRQISKILPLREAIDEVLLQEWSKRGCPDDWVPNAWQPSTEETLESDAWWNDPQREKDGPFEVNRTVIN